MSKSSKNKKNKVPKLTEAEYTAYLSSLKEEKPPIAISENREPSFCNKNEKRL